MAPIALPQITSQLTSIKPLSEPSDPPTAHDVARARFFTSRLQNAYNRNEPIDMDDVGRAVQYEQQLAAVSVNYDHDDEGNQGIPAWFEAAIQRALATALAPVHTQLGALNGKVDALNGRVDVLNGKVDALQLEGAKTRAMVARMMNQDAGDGDQATLEIVPFRDGTDPTLPPHRLPPLTSPAAINNLSASDRDKYYRGYYVGGLPRYPLRIPAILSAIGRRE